MPRTTTDRLAVIKTHKLFIAGAFPRSESGRSMLVWDRKGDPLARVSKASRKDLRAAVEAARNALPAWSNADAYLRGQILYRLAEMIEGKREELAHALHTTAAATPASAVKEVAASVDRVLCYAGWADKIGQVLGCANGVQGPYHNFTVPGPTGVVACVCPDEPALLGLVSLLCPAVVSGCTAVALVSETSPLAAIALTEAIATSDVPPGVINILTGKREELVPHIAAHRDIDAVHAAGIDQEHATLLRLGSAENLKRAAVHNEPPPFTDDAYWDSPDRIESFCEMKTIWHPSAV